MAVEGPDTTFPFGGGELSFEGGGGGGGGNFQGFTTPVSIPVVRDITCRDALPITYIQVSTG